MRRTLLALVLVAAMLPAPAQADVTCGGDLCTMVLDSTPGTATVDMVADSGDVIRFEARDGSGTNHFVGAPPSAASSARVTLTLPVTGGEDEEITLSMSRTSSSNPWAAAINVDDSRLLKGTWDVQATGVFGGIPHHTAIGKLTVNAAGVGPFILRAQNTDAETGIVYVGDGQSVQVVTRYSPVQSAPLMRSVTYTIGQVGPLDWSSPYSLDAANFQPPGTHVMKVHAEDRLGQKAELSFHVYADTVRPAVTASIPDVLYRDIPNPVRLTVDEHSTWQASARFGDADAATEGEAGSTEITLHLVPEELGSGAVSVTVRDLVGNELTLVQASRVEALRTDLLVSDVEQVDGGAIGQEPVVLRVTAAQIEGLVDVPVNVTFRGDVVGQMTVNKTVQGSADISFDLPPGQHTGVLALQVAEGVNEVNATNQQVEFTVEKYLARVLHGADRYHIRGDATGIPVEAVDEAGNSYPLVLKDRALGSVYAFEVDGTELWWDPSSRTTTVPLDDDRGGDKGIPGFPAALLLVALALLLRRR